jgi:thymidylate kinase
MMALELIDRAAGEPVLLFGAPPPEGRDIDLLVRPDAAVAVSRGLADAGFHRHDVEWVRFTGCSVESVDLVPAGSWRLPADEEEALFADGLPLDGHERVLRPAPHHVLCILSRRFQDGPAPLAEKKRGRAARAVREDPAAWDRARDRADAWAGAEAVDRLRAAVEGTLAAPGDGGAPASRGALQRLRLAKRRAGLSRSARLISLSGLDGSGKSTQVRALQSTLARLGIESEVEWTRLEWTTLWEGASQLDRIGRPVKRALELVTRTRGDEPRQARYGERPPPTPALEIRERSRIISHGWVLILAVVHGLAQRRAIEARLLRGEVVICDRYTLDSAVHLRRRYGAERRFRAQIVLMHMLSPRPVRAYFIDVPGAVALARKPDHFDRGELDAQAQAYREEHLRLGVRRLDGERPPESLCEEIAEDVWRALRKLG